MRKKATIMLAALGLATASACGDESGDAQGDNASRRGSPEVTLGAIVPMTGELGPFGAPLLKAANLGAERVGEGIRVVSADEQTDPTAATSAARKLVGDGATCLIGPAASADTIAVAEAVSSRQGVPQITPSSTSAEITTLEDDGYVFRTAPSDDLQGVALAQLVADKVGDGELVSLAARNDAYGQGFVDRVKVALEQMGLATQGPVLYDPNATGYDSEAGQIVANDPAAYVIIDFPQTYQKVGAALVRTGRFDARKLFTADGLAGETIASLGKGLVPASLEGARGTRPSTPTTGASAKAFQDLFRRSPGTHSHSPFDAQNFDAAVLCGLAAIAAGSTDGADVRERLTSVSGPPGAKYTFQQLPEAVEALHSGRDIDYEGVSGPIDFDRNGDPSAATYDRYEYRDGKLVVTGQNRVSDR